MADSSPRSPSALLGYLPAIYQEDPFIGQYLLAFEKILLGRADGVDYPEIGLEYPRRGLEETIDQLATYFDPQQTESEFLSWLADWTAFSLREDLPLEKQRDFIANVIQLYRWRGTRHNLEKLLAIFVPHTDVSLSPPKVTDTQDVGGTPHFFQVTILLARTTPAVVNRQASIAHALIELEKPAHTYYELKVLFPSMQIGVASTVGVDTLLGAVM